MGKQYSYKRYANIRGLPTGSGSENTGKIIRVMDNRFGVSPTKRMHSYVPEDRLKALISYAIEEGIDPNTALAVAMKESNIGNTRSDYGVNYYPPRTEVYNRLIEVEHEMLTKYGKRLPVIPRDFDSLPIDEDNRVEGHKWKGTKDEIYAEIIDMEKKYGADTIKKQYERYWDAKEKLEAFNSELNSWSAEKLFVKTLKHNLDYGKQLGYKDELMQIQAFNGYGYNEAYKVNMKENPVYAKEILNLRENVIKKDPNVRKYIKEITKQNSGMVN